MPAHPPHLPPPSCKISTHQKIQRLKVLFVATFFGLLGGFTGAAVMIGWIWPSYGGGDTYDYAQQARSYSSRQLENLVQKEISTRVVGVYSQESSVAGAQYFAVGDKLGDGAIISSDGWVAMYLPRATINLKRARALLGDGAVYQFEKSITDTRSGLLFLKISLSDEKDRQRSGGQFPVINLVDAGETPDEVYVRERDQWRVGLVNGLDWNFWSRPHLDTAPAFVYALAASYDHGSIVINSQGRLSGFMVGDNMFVSSAYLSRVMPSVLGGQKIAYASLGVEGWYDAEQPAMVNGARQSGSFVVSRVSSTASRLRPGDVIVEVGGKIVTPDNLWYNIYGNKTVRAKVWRSDKFVDIETGVINI